MARPTKYKPEYAEQTAKLCELGATDADLADFFKVSVRTIYRWLITEPEFCQATKGGKDAADERVERSLYHRAVGYSHPDVHISTYEGAVIQTPITKHYPPDTAAGIFWMKNRRGWKDKQEVAHSNPDGSPLAPVLNVSLSRSDQP